ncbi:MAG: hypothetical protein AAF804_16460, partial [Bacteroidota bacterium]
MPAVFISPVVNSQRQLLAPLIATPLKGSVISFLTNVADLLHQAFQDRDDRSMVNISNWHPNYTGSSSHEIMKATLTLDDFRLITAREYGWDRWADIPETATFHAPFEAALELFLNGEIELLRKHLNEYPSLAQASVPFGHQAKLLHYAGSNGVETWRQ